MDIIQYASSLMPSVRKEGVEKDFEDSITVLREMVDIQIRQTVELALEHRIETDVLPGIRQSFYVGFGNPVAKGKDVFPVLSDILGSWENVSGNLGYISDLCDEELPERLITSGLTTRSLIILRSSEHAVFMAKYAGLLVNHVLCQLAAESKIDPDAVKRNGPFGPLSKGDLKYLTVNASCFGASIKAYGGDRKKFVEAFKDIPSLEVAGNEEALSAFADDEVDPIDRFGSVGFNWSPIHHINLAIDDWQIARYKAAEQRKRTTELRILVLRSKLEHGQDARAEFELNKQLERLEDLEATMRSIEG